MGKYNPFLPEFVSLKNRKAKRVIRRIIVSAATAIVVKSVRLMSLVAMEAKIKQGPDI